jgi:glycosyltransferase involved in cell wall biosynthesis
MLTRMGVGVRLLIAGTPDPANPTSISPDEIAAWARQPNVTYCGFVADIPAFWASAHIAVLPSRREGLPMTLL